MFTITGKINDQRDCRFCFYNRIVKVIQEFMQPCETIDSVETLCKVLQGW